MAAQAAVANNEALKNKIQKKQNFVMPDRLDNSSMVALLAAMDQQIAVALPKHLSNERFQRQVMTLFNSNPKYLQCDARSFVAAMMTVAQLGLDLTPEMGMAHIIPRKIKGRMMAQFQIGYKGILDLCWRSGMFRRIEAREVYEKDDFLVTYGVHGTLEHRPPRTGGSNRGPVIGYYALFELINGGISYNYITKEEMEAFAGRYSEAYKYDKNEGVEFSPWSTNFDAMGQKTALKNILKTAPKSIEMNRAMASDEAIRTELSADMSEIIPIAGGYREALEGQVITEQVNQITGEIQQPTEGQLV